MNDPANIFIVTGARPTACANGVPGLYISTRYDGRHWPERLCGALNLNVARSRWGTPRSLATIIAVNVSRTAKGDTPTAAANVELSTTSVPSGRPVITVDPYSKIVAFAALGQEADMTRWYDHMSFEEYTTQKRADYPGDPGDKSSLKIYHIRVAPWIGDARDYVAIAHSAEEARHLMPCDLAEYCVYITCLGSAASKEETPRIVCREGN